MNVQRRIQISLVNEVTVVSFVDRKILDAANIQELGEELFSLVEEDGHKELVLDFRTVEFLSSAALNKLIILDKKVKGKQGRLKLCNLKPEIQEVFVITRLNQLFDIRDSVDEALAGFKAEMDPMDKRDKKRLDTIHQHLQRLRQLLAAAKKQPDEPGDVQRLQKELAALEAEAQKMKTG